jgi:hypothetical protein
VKRCWTFWCPCLGLVLNFWGSTGVIGDKGDFTERFVVRDLFDVALCGVGREVLRFDGVF